MAKLGKKLFAFGVVLVLMFSLAAPVMAAESPGYTGPVREYADKELWWDTTIYGGHYSAYQIVAGNGDNTFDVDAFVNSQMGELIMSRIKYELVLVGNMNWNDPFMVNYWANQGVIQTSYKTGTENEWLAFAPNYMMSSANTNVYPLIIAYHGGGGTIFEAENHGFVHNCYNDGYIVVCPEGDAFDADYLATFLEEIEAEGYPIDRSRVYLIGMSMGGVTSISNSLANSGLVAGIAVHSSPRGLVNSSFDALYGQVDAMPMYLAVGESDMNQLPLSTSNIDGLNKWLAMNDCSPAQATGGNMVGITGDDVYVEVIDGADHTIVDYYNTGGVNMVKVIGIEGHPHWVSYSYPNLAWDFLQKFSRDAEGNLVVTENPADLQVSTSKNIVESGEYFEVNAALAPNAASNAATLTFDYDAGKFEYLMFTADSGVTVIDTVNDANNGKLTITLANMNGYSLGGMGHLLFRARTDVQLLNEKTPFHASIDYVVLANGEKFICSSSSSGKMGTRGLKGDTNNDGVVDLIDLSNMIDWFGVTAADVQWDAAEYFDFNENAKIDISDISTVARMIV